MRRALLALCLAAACLLLCGLSTAAEGTNQYYYSYHSGKLIDSIPAFELKATINSNSMDQSEGSRVKNLKIGSIVDVAVCDDRLYLVDEDNARVYVTDRETYTITSFIKTIRDEQGSIVMTEDGEQLTLVKPRSVFLYDKENELYIADAGAKRIVVLDADGLFLKRVITRPANMFGDTEFVPSKLIVTPIGKIYFTVDDGIEGIVELNYDGSFSCYFGVNEPEVNVIDYLWKTLASDEQREKMSRTYAPAFSNIDVDAEGFIYAVSSDAASLSSVFRFNGKGVNVIRSVGNATLTGDSDMLFNKAVRSQFIDIAVSDYGMYATMDKTNGRVFIYNFDGYLLSVFGARGNMQGQTREPSGIAWVGDDLIITDKTVGAAFIYTPTAFGKHVLDAEEHYYNGRWAEADVSYREALRLNANYYVAYSGIGRNCLMSGQYEEAMYYFEMADDKNGYSQAYEYYRGEFIKNNYIWFFLVILLAIAAIIGSEVRYMRKNRQNSR